MGETLSVAKMVTDIPPVLPGQGGFFDADLQILYNGGLNGNIQIPMFDCTVG